MIIIAMRNTDVFRDCISLLATFAIFQFIMTTYLMWTASVV
jgi:hypothetical protein